MADFNHGDVRNRKRNLGALSASLTVQDVRDGDFFVLSLAANYTLTFGNLPADGSKFFIDATSSSSGTLTLNGPGAAAVAAVASTSFTDNDQNIIEVTVGDRASGLSIALFAVV